MTLTRRLRCLFMSNYSRIAFLLALLMAFNATNAETQSSRNEDYYQAIAAKQLSGETEVTMGDRTRCDIVTKTHAIEVDFKQKWGEAIGQSLNYAFQADKRAGIVLIVENKNDLKELIRLRSIILHYELPIDLWMMDEENDEMSEF